MLWLCGEETGPRLAAEANSDVMLVSSVWYWLLVEMAWQGGGGPRCHRQRAKQAKQASEE